jgi:TatD DNase family protein
MIDTHAHLYDKIFMSEISTVINEIQTAGVKEVWLPNCDVETWTDLNLLSEQYPAICKPMLGLHPTYVKEDFEVQLVKLKTILNHKSVLAIGEIGLDYYWDLSFVDQQKIAFERQCHWALDKHIWIDVHCRKAYADLIKILKKPEFKEVRGIIHCFSGDATEAKTLVDLGFLLGIGGVITYKNTNLFEDIRQIPLEFIVLETDAPYLTPVPHRGKPNSPRYIPLIAQKLADLYEITIEAILSQTTSNALKLKEYSNFQ